MDKEFLVGCIAFVLFVMTVTSCTAYQSQNDNKAIVEMVKAGATPIAAKCAVKADGNACALSAAGARLE